MASDRTDEEVLEAIWRMPDDSPALFSDRFLREVPPDQIKAILGDLIAKCGGLVAVEAKEESGEFKLVTEHCEVAARITRNAEGTIDGLLFHQPARRGASLDDLLDEIVSFEGAVAYALIVNGELIAGHDADRPMAVGSAFKLIVLAALADRIARGKASWADVVTLEEKHISLPSGRLQNMPVGSPFTLHTLAAAMIADSDNTATDVLIDVVGRGQLEALSGLKPFLTTREVFQLKADDAAYELYAASDLPERYAVLEGLANVSLPTARDVLKPWKPEAEWLLSTRTLCEWIGKVADVNLTQIESGPVHPDDWERVSFKGGSETGVLNLTTLARDAKGREICFSATWNADEEVDDFALSGLYAGVFHALKMSP